VKNEINETPPVTKIDLNNIPGDGHIELPLNKQRAIEETPPKKRGIRNNKIIV
jgi:hypothetical protein